MNIPSGIYSSFSDKDLVESLVEKKNIYNDVHSPIIHLSKNQNLNYVLVYQKQSTKLLMEKFLESLAHI